MLYPVVLIQANRSGRLKIGIAIIWQCLLFLSVFGQIKIPKPSIVVQNDSIVIDYHILGSTLKDTFQIYLEIEDENGKELVANALDGDIGSRVPGGKDKQIVWDLEVDKLYINMDIKIELVAELISKPLVAQTEEKSSSEVIKEPDKTPSQQMTFKPILYATLFPGWGLSYNHNRRLYLTAGVTAVGLLGSAVLFNQLASNNYSTYKKIYDFDENKVAQYYTKAENQKLISQICGYSALVLWIANIGYTTFDTYKQSKKSNFGLSFYLEDNTPRILLTLCLN